MASQPIRNSGFPAFLLVTTVLTGAAIMTIEVLGSRVLGPFFGVSLFVWTALITVTLLALALGYAAGGHLADSNPDPAWLYLIILAAGVLVASVPWLRSPVLKSVIPLGLRAGALLAALLLFGPALFLLGGVSPYVIRIAARNWTRLGRTVGTFYALSTAGSLAGTLATGYFLIAYLGVSMAFFACGALLVTLAATYFAAFGRRREVLALPLAMFVLLPRLQLPSATMPDGTQVRVVVSRDSYYGNLKVLDYEAGPERTRELVIDGLVQGGIDLDNGLSVYEYPYLLELLPLAIHPGIRSSLQIGLGAGVVPRRLTARGISVDVVDIDPEVAAIAREYFGFAGMRVHQEDARAHLVVSDRTYDLIVVDAFNGDTTPAHLLSVEALRLVKARLNPGGLMAMNLVGCLGQHGSMTRSVIKTLQAVFREVAVHPTADGDPPEGVSNLVVVARDGPVIFTSTPEAAIHPLAEQGVRAGLFQTVSVPDRDDAFVLTDDFNPIDVRDIWVKEQVRRAILESTDLDVLLL